MHEVAALLAAAAVASIVARLIGMPLVPLLLLSGIGLSALSAPSPEFLENALVLGVSFLLFVAGLELDPGRVRVQRHAALRVGLAQFGVLAVLGFLIARGLGYGPVESGYVALALPASSTLVGLRLLKNRRQMFEPFGRLTVGTLLLQDLLILLAIPLVTGAGSGWVAVLTKTGGLLVLSLFALGVRRWGSKALLRVEDEPELVLLGALALLFLFIAGAGFLDLPILVGAFLAGMALSSFPVNGIVRAEVAPIGDFFVAIFFTALGALVRLPSLPELEQAAILIAAVVLVTPPLVLFVAERSGFTATSAAETGLLLSQTSEISLVVVMTGMIAGQVSESLFVIVAVVTVVTMSLTPFISTDDMARRLSRLHRNKVIRPGPPPSDHVLLIGVGTSGMPLLEDLIVTGCRVAVIDDDPIVIRRLEEAGIYAVRGAASDPKVLRAAGADRARVISSSIRRTRDNAKLLEMAGEIPVMVRVFEASDAEWVAEQGGRPVLYSEATADGLIEWFEGERQMLDASLAARSE